MIISPSVSQVLKGIAHEMGTSLKDGLDNPVKTAQIDTIIGVLAATAQRADHQSRIIAEESTAILKTAAEFVAGGKATAELKQAIEAYDETASEYDRYEQASQILCCMADQGRAVGDSLYDAVRTLMSQRLQNESALIGSGFEAAGRG